MTYAVVTDARQLARFERAGGGTRFRVATDRRSFARILSAKGYTPAVLDEHDVADRWDQMNAWGAAAALAWMSLCEEAGLFPDSRLPRAAQLYLSYVLVQAAKARVFAERLLAALGTDAVWTFAADDVPDFPAFSGNAFLNRCLEDVAAERGVPRRTIGAGHPRHAPSAATPWRRRAKSSIARALGLLAPAQVQLLASGALKHVGPVVAEARRRGVRAGLYDTEFHLDQWLFARRHGAAYRVAPERGGSEFAAEEGHMAKAAALAAASGTFRFGGADLFPLVNALILPGLERYRRRLAERVSLDAEAIREAGAGTVVLDEDFAPKGAPLAVSAARAGADVYCVSHANLIVDFAVPHNLRKFALSTTLVQSEHEARMYEARGWDRTRLAVTGTPRYDRLADAPRRPSGGPKRVVFCPGVFEPHSPDHVGYAGLHVECYADVQEPVVEAVLKAAAGKDVELIVKPHHAGLEASYRAAVRRYGRGARVRFYPHSADLLDLIAGADALVATYWTTAIVEAAIAGVPSVFARFRPAPSRALAEYEKAGLVRVAADAAALEREFEAIASKGRALYAERVNAGEDFLGPRDGRSLGRVGELVMPPRKPERYRRVLTEARR